MEKIKQRKEYICLTAIVIMSALFNFMNLSIEGTANAYYAAGVKSMTLNLKNFFFVSMDPAGYVTIDKPAFGFWMQAISAKIFGFSGWSILLPQALAGVLSTILIYRIVKKSFGSTAGLISALCLAVTPVFVAVSRNNTIDNQLVFVLLLACWAFSAATREGKFKYLVLCMIFIGIGFNIKTLQAYMIVPAIYITYLLSSKISIKKRVTYLIGGMVILLAISFSWTVIVDSISSDNRPYVGSSNNNTEMGLITGHNGTERLNLSSLFGSTSNSQGGPGQGGPGGGGGAPGQGGPGGGAPGQGSQDQEQQDQVGQDQEQQAQGQQSQDQVSQDQEQQVQDEQSQENKDQGNQKQGNQGPGGQGHGGPGGGGGSDGGNRLSGTFGNQTPAGITRLFSKNILSDQIIWFIPLALFGFIAGSIKEKLRFKLDTDKKRALVLWFLWLFPEFIYFSFNTGLFHPHYLTMMAAPAAALSGIGIVTMWEMYKDGGWRAWLLPLALLTTGAVHMLMLSYFYSSSPIVKILMALLIVLCFIPALILAGMNLFKNKLLKIKKVLVCLAVAGIIVSPMTGSGAAMFYAVDSSNPSAGLELLPAQLTGNQSKGGNQNKDSNKYADLIKFLNNHQVNGKSQIVVNSSGTAEDLTINTDLYVGSLSGFMERGTVMSLDQFKARVKSGEIRYVLADSGGGMDNSDSEIMKWVKENGQLISYASTDSSQSSNQNSAEQIYDLADSIKS